MDTKAVMWLILGFILVLAGITSSLREEKSHPSREARPAVVLPQPAASEPVAGKKFDTGFTIDPIKGLKRRDDDQNANYFK